MIATTIKVLLSHGKQYIPRLDKPSLPNTFRGRPQLSAEVDKATAESIAALCPTKAIGTAPFSLDMGRCLFCGECAFRNPEAIKFTNNPHTASNTREGLIITANSTDKKLIDPERCRKEIIRIYGRALKLRQVSAGGDNSAEMELNASMNVNFDFGRYGIDFVASPRHADGIVITGPISKNMAIPLELCYNAVADPKVVILTGTDAISGGLFADSPAIDRSFLTRHHIDLYVPGNPPHPLTFIDGVMQMLQRKY